MLVVGRRFGQRQHPQGHQRPGQIDEGLDGIREQADRTGELPGPALEQDGGDGGGDGQPGVALQRCRRVGVSFSHGFFQSSSATSVTAVIADQVTGGALDIVFAVEHEALAVLKIVGGHFCRRWQQRHCAMVCRCTLSRRPVKQTVVDTATAAKRAPTLLGFAVLPPAANTLQAFNAGESAVGVMNAS
ncbi:hypothetical protein SDC9_144971 [bioreactor metagenome]|uniref:Uncharacterized protein n=1 Tax=bioreactor metagenome TaxID=1076179 RepID=A0A645E7D9_9ZZZZ